MAELFTDADRAELFNIEDLGTAVLVDGVPATGVFQHGTAEALGIMGTHPLLFCASASVASATRGTPVVIAGTDYTVVRVEPDGQGFALVVLQLESGGAS